MATCALSSASKRGQTSNIACLTARLMAFLRSGRLMVMTATPSLTS